MQATLEQKKQSETYQMPHASLGMPVLWYQDGHPATVPFVGFIAEISQRTVNISLHAPNGAARMKHGVRHVSDPLLKDTEAGAWDFTEESKRLRCVEIQVHDLMSDLSPPVKSAES